MQPINEKKEVIYIFLMDAARLYKRTRQSLILMIKNGRVKAKKETTRWEIELNSLINYFETRWKRCFADESKGEMSLTDAAKYLGVPYLRLYHAVNKKYLKSFRIKHAIIINKEELDKYSEYLKLKRDFIDGGRINSNDQG